MNSINKSMIDCICFAVVEMQERNVSLKFVPHEFFCHDLPFVEGKGTTLWQLRSHVEEFCNFRTR